MTYLIDLNHVTHYYEHSHRPAVSDISLRIEPGQRVALVGQSGCGKTTLINIALGFITATQGSVHIADPSTTGLVFQNPASSLDPRWTVERIIREGAENVDTQQVVDVMESMNLDYRTLKDAYVSELSGGQAQRVAFARAVISKPRLLVADEPMSAVDVLGKQQIVQTLHTLYQSYQCAMLCVVHDLGIARKISDHVIVMRQGTIVEQGATADVIAHPQQDYTRQLISAAQWA